MRRFPEEHDEMKELEELKAKPWMVEMLKANPSYVYWGSFEDYMSKDKEGWDSRVIVDTVEEGLWHLDEYNEVVNFYFEVSRASKDCECCDGGGYNPETTQIQEDWYDFANTGRRWCDNITQDEVDALWDAGRLRGDFPEKPTADEVNEWSKKRHGHDAINRWICVEQRAKRIGVYGKCESCEGKGYVFTEPEAKLSLQLWVLHPRKGASRGVYIKNVKFEEVPKVVEYLKEAQRRNNERFSKLETITNPEWDAWV